MKKKRRNKTRIFLGEGHPVFYEGFRVVMRDIDSVPQPLYPPEHRLFWCFCKGVECKCKPWRLVLERVR